MRALRLVTPAHKMAPARPFVAQIFDGSRRAPIPVSGQRFYSTPESALKNAISWLLRDGHVGHVIEIADRESGIQFATAKVRANGTIQLMFTWKELPA